MLTFTIPGIVRNTSNLREHHMARARRVKAERNKAMLKCPKWTGGPLLVITLTRYGTRDMDGDGLQASLKGTRDGIAARLRVDDGSPLVEWRYAQARCAAGKEHVEVAIYPYARQETFIAVPSAFYTARILPDEKPSTVPTPAVYKPVMDARASAIRSRK